MQWEDEGVLIAAKKYSDQCLILSLFTKNNGRRKGLIRISKSNNYKFQIGNSLFIEWRARSLENLGYFKCELIKSTTHYFITSKIKAVAISSISSILEKVLPEGERYTALHEDLILLIDTMQNNDNTWQKYYLKFELKLLSQLGFALDLAKCTVSKTSENLKFISPKTGRAVSEKIGRSYTLLPLPKMLHDIYNNNDQADYKFEEFQLSLKVLGYFLNKHLFSQFGIKLPNYRKLLVS